MTEQKQNWSDYNYRDNPQYPPQQQYSPHVNSHSQQLFDYKMNKYQNYPLSPASSTDSNCVKNYDYTEHVTDNQNNIEENVNENNWRYQQFSPSSQSLPSPQAQDYGRLNSPINYSRCDYPQSVPNHLQRLSQSSPHFGYHSPGSPNSHLAQKQFRISTPTPLLTPGPSPVPSPLYSPQMFKPIVKRMPRGKNDNKPRGRMTAYAFFVQTCREEHKKKHPDENVVFAEFSKKCAERWKTMLDKEKRRFHEMAEKDKVRYDSEMQNYVPSKAEKRGKKRKHIKDPNAPKRSLSAFFWFCNDERPKVKALNPEYGVGDVAKELGRRWADADPDMKSKYEAMAEKDKARYDREMTAYKKKPKSSADDDDDDELEEDEDEDDDE